MSAIWAKPLITSTSAQKADELIAWLRSYAENRINSQMMDERRLISPHVVLDFGNQGLLGMIVPEKFGGLELSYTDVARVITQLSAIDLTLGVFVGLNNILGVYPILKYATKARQQELLPDLAAGRTLASFAITESSAGSNPQAMQMQAKQRTKNEWSLSGSKIWIGTASWSQVTSVFAKEVNLEDKSVGISGFLVQQGTPGFSCGPEARTMGMRGMVQNKISLSDVRVSSQDLLSQSGQGLAVAYDVMNMARFGLAVISVAGIKRALQLIKRYADRRIVGSGILSRNPHMVLKMNDLLCASQALDLLVQKTATLLDQKKEIPVEIFLVCKILGPEFLFSAADSLMQSLGGRGYLESNIAPQLFRDARLLRIFEGPTETLQMHLGSSLLNDSKRIQTLFPLFPKSGQRFNQFMLDVEAIKNILDSAPADAKQKIRNKYFLQSCCGALASFAILHAAIENDATAPAFEMLNNWCDANYQRQLAQCEKLSQQLLITNETEISNSIEQFKTTIGDVEQTLAGEDFDLDPMLAKQKAR